MAGTLGQVFTAIAHLNSADAAVAARAAEFQLQFGVFAANFKQLGAALDFD